MVVRQILSLVAGVRYPVASRNIKVTLPYDEGDTGWPTTAGSVATPREKSHGTPD